MSVAKRVFSGWLAAPALACFLLAACGDDDGPERSVPAADGGMDASGTTADASTSPNVDAALDGGQPPPQADASLGITDKTVFTPISATGHDRFYGVTYDATGSIYAVGQTSDSTAAGTDYSFVLAKYGAAGVLDASFGNGGIATLNVVPGGGSVEVARAVVVQANGKIVVAGNAEHRAFAVDAGAGPIANDADVFLARFLADGRLDTTFGSNGSGIVQQNIGDGIVTQPATLADGGIPNPVLSASDSLWSLAQTAEGKLVVHAATRGLGPNVFDGGVRVDSDFALVRFTADGVLDTTFGESGATPGTVRTDFNNTNVSVRSATVLPNGNVVGAGYSTNNVLTGTSTTAQNPVLYEVTADGTPNAAFGTTDPVATPGVWHDYARPDMKGCEAYGATLQGNKLVTLGYGPTPNTAGVGTDLVWLRFEADGTPDTSWGTGGVTFQDPGGYSDNGRALTTLPDNRLLGVGRSTPKPAVAPMNAADAPADAVIAVLTEAGQPDTSFGTGGVRLYDFGGPGDHLWAVTVSPDKKHATAVGIQTSTGATANDNAALVILNLP